MRGNISDTARIEHILDSALQVEEVLTGYTFERFNGDPILRLAIVKLLEIVGEAANHITEETKSRNRNIEWHKMIGLRNLVIHEYFRIDYRIVWDAAVVFLPTLKKEIETINLSTE